MKRGADGARKSQAPCHTPHTSARAHPRVLFSIRKRTRAFFCRHERTRASVRATLAATVTNVYKRQSAGRQLPCGRAKWAVWQGDNGRLAEPERPCRQPIGSQRVGQWARGGIRHAKFLYTAGPCQAPGGAWAGACRGGAARKKGLRLARLAISAYICSANGPPRGARRHQGSPGRARARPQGSPAYGQRKQRKLGLEVLVLPHRTTANLFIKHGSKRRIRPRPSGRGLPAVACA